MLRGGGASSPWDFGTCGAAGDPCSPPSSGRTAGTGRGQRGLQVLPPSQHGGAGVRVCWHPPQLGVPMRCEARWGPTPGLRAAQSWFLLILLAPRRLAALASAGVTLGSGRAGSSLPSRSCWHCHPATSRGTEPVHCPCPCQTPPLPPMCLSGDSFLCHFKELYFYRTYQNISPSPSSHLACLCPPHPCHGAACPQCLSHALGPSIPLFPAPPLKKTKTRLVHAPVMPSLLGERGTLPGVPAGGTLGTSPGWAEVGGQLGP